VILGILADLELQIPVFIEELLERFSHGPCRGRDRVIIAIIY
jgi:hypothetical protein